MEVKKDIDHLECKFAVYCPPPEYDPSMPDIHLVKERRFYKDGTSDPNVRFINNFKRKFYVTKKGFRNHQQRKEWEDLDKLNMFESTQSTLSDNVAKAIGEPWLSGNMRMINRNPYIYGTDILSTAIIKHTYQEKYPQDMSRYSVAVFDVETDMLYGTGKIIMATLSFGNRVFTAIVDTFMEGQTDVHARLQKALLKYIPDVVAERNIHWDVVLVKDDASVVTECFKRAHEWMPDIIAIWGINFDMPKTVAALQMAGIEPKDIFSDPKIPAPYRYFKYKQGSKQKVTASGKITPVKPHEQWHTVYCPSSFYFIDAMCAYKRIRLAGAEEQSYSLDAILKKHKIGGKLRFKEAEGLSKSDWHVFMQDKYPFEYVIYNVYDCVSIELLDETTLDLCLSMPMMSGCSDFEHFKSQPRRLVDSLHWECLKNNKCIGSTSDQMTSELDSKTLGLEGWIN